MKSEEDVACKVNVGQPQSAGLTYVMPYITVSYIVSVSWSADFGKLVLYTLITDNNLNFVLVAHVRHNLASSLLRLLNRNFLPILDIDASCGVRNGMALEVVVIVRTCLRTNINSAMRISFFEPLI